MSHLFLSRYRLQFLQGIGCPIPTTVKVRHDSLSRGSQRPRPDSSGSATCALCKHYDLVQTVSAVAKVLRFHTRKPPFRLKAIERRKRCTTTIFDLLFLSKVYSVSTCSVLLSSFVSSVSLRIVSFVYLFRFCIPKLIPLVSRSQ